MHPHAPSHYELRSLEVLQRPTAHASLGRILLALLAVTLTTLFLPWQQNVRGKGAVTALRPQDRPQVVPALIAGRITAWHVSEGQFVKQGTLLVTLAEIRESFLDPNTLRRTAEQVDGKRDAVLAKREKASALARQLSALDSGRVFSNAKARNDVALKEAAVDAAALDSVVAAQQLSRNAALFNEGLKSRAEFEAYQTKLQAATAKLVEKRREAENARVELAAIDASYDEKIAKAQSERSETFASIGEGEADVAKLQMTQSALTLRNDMYRIVAPQDGYVVRAVKSGVGETVKEGDAVVTVMPADPQLAVELYVRPVDVPLLRVGRKVRLQFDGWPAIQFSGWPSVAVGTFGGVIRVIDPVSASDGSYRVLVAADPSDDAWPKEIRNGSGVLGWAMLDEVRLGFELWRRLNGFPPSIAAPPSGAGTKR